MIGSQIVIANVLVDLNLAVWYRIAICIIMCKQEILVGFYWWLHKQTAKPPNLIQYHLLVSLLIAQQSCDVQQLSECCHSCQGCFLLLLLKQHLKRCYGLTDR